MLSRDCSVLTEYFDQVGGREKIWKELDRAISRKRLGRGPMSSDSPMTGKTNNAPLTTVAEWTPPAGSWEDEIDSITGFDDENGGKLTVYLAWKNGKKTKHPTAVVYGKCPQKVKNHRQETRADLTALDASMVRRACGDYSQRRGKASGRA